TVPFDPGRTREGNQEVTRREQSITMEFTHLTAQDTLEAYRTFSVDEDYSRYKALDWWVSGFFVSGADIPAAQTDSLQYFVRFSSDEQGQNYYEYRAPLPVSAGRAEWHEVHLQLTDPSNLQLDPRFPKTAPISRN